MKGTMTRKRSTGALKRPGKWRWFEAARRWAASADAMRGNRWVFAVEWRESKRMANPSITIPLDPETARAYDSAAPEQKRKIQALLSLWLRELAVGEYPSVQQVLDDAGRKAKDRGLTADILDSLLKGA
jgi:hypothetical protein